MDRAISASDANQRFSEMLREVQEGETFVVTSRGRPVAKVSPIDDLDRQDPALDALLDFVATLPRRHGKAWRREDLYE
ncbi:type II toxin-antitoxin system Phd/YefM family antitoxin [Sphingomonas sp. BIUV-7]|uniref:Antitoxin n=1 Tax=Sphingomonas natans TaxID=3063330 RepID=A0ABT8Y840_9SPHN|nr:type II toxin-antitoxin system Phd/YefM family antitoxin [Sphingomonas sp. BIUV-7]MDO6414162.1 type II toxin-antitoxin system Phd/YefM family antitoxin [Sphingomonas sp. BIUV-7]